MFVNGALFCMITVFLFDFLDATIHYVVIRK